MGQVIIGIDVGGTKVAGGLVTLKGRLIESQIVPTHADKGFARSYGQITQQLKAQERPKAFVQLEKCTGCIYCVNACPFDCITMERAPSSITGAGGIASTVAVVDQKKCTGCTLCELDCPYDAIHIWRQDDERAKVLTEHNKQLWARIQAA